MSDFDLNSVSEVKYKFTFLYSKFIYMLFIYVLRRLFMFIGILYRLNVFSALKSIYLSIQI